MERAPQCLGWLKNIPEINLHSDLLLVGLPMKIGVYPVC